jgi:hypothetical protein
MVKKIKKPPVKPETRSEWLRRYEGGESPTKIADHDDFDVRTVRKHLELARQEREVREARSAVLRNALERHYADLCEYAEKLDAQIEGDHTIALAPESDRMLSALRQHLPHSPLWNNLRKWNQLHEENARLEDEVKMRLKEEIEPDPKLDVFLRSDERVVVDAISVALAFQIKAWSQGWKGLRVEDDLKSEPAEEGLVDVHYGLAVMDRVKQEHVAYISDALIDFESRVRVWQQYLDMKKNAEELKQIKAKLRDELAIITLRRVVPGRCKYCPI